MHCHVSFEKSEAISNLRSEGKNFVLNLVEFARREDPDITILTTSEAEFFIFP